MFISYNYSGRLLESRPDPPVVSDAFYSFSTMYLSSGPLGEEAHHLYGNNTNKRMCQ